MKSVAVKVAVFIAGFSLVYILLGISVAFLGNFLKLNMSWLFAAAGVILIIFGLHVMNVFRIKWLDKQWGGMEQAEEAQNLIGSFLVGVAFAIGWSPCTGPIMVAILGLAAEQNTVFAGGILLLFYCIGLGMPFMLVGLAVGKFLKLFERIQKHMRKVEIASGILLILLGLLFVTQHANFLREIFGTKFGISTEFLETIFVPAVGEGITLMAVVAALLAGFLSFVSPCVLPLLPSYVAFIAGAETLDEFYDDEEVED